jgi:hypothetical protein
MPIEINKHSTSITGKSVMFYRMLHLKMGLAMEMKGMRLTAKAPPCFKIIKQEFGLKGTKQAVYEQFCKLVDAESAKQVRVYGQDTDPDDGTERYHDDEA